MTGEAHHAQTVRHFGRLAARYDHRHRRYNERTLSQALEALRLAGTGRLLDVGCGTGEFERLAHQRFPEATLVGVDVTPAMLAVAREKFRHTPLVAFQMAHAEALPFASDSFDAVVSCNMLHHVREVARFLGECARVLRPQGHLIVVDWCRDFPHARLAHYWLRLVKRSYTKMYCADELIERLTPLSLAVDQVSRFFVPPFFGMMRVRAIKRSQTA